MVFDRRRLGSVGGARCLAARCVRQPSASLGFVCAAAKETLRKILFLPSFSCFEFSMAIRLHVLEFDVVVNLHQESGGVYIWAMGVKDIGSLYRYT